VQACEWNGAAAREACGLHRYCDLTPLQMKLCGRPRLAGPDALDVMRPLGIDVMRPLGIDVMRPLGIDVMRPLRMWAWYPATAWSW
jgi:hypothetical protein